MENQDIKLIIDDTTFVLRLGSKFLEYCDYWNFNNGWTWIGTIKGKSKQVICPRLAWEQ